MNTDGQSNFIVQNYTPSAITTTNPVTVTIPGVSFTQGQAFRTSKFMKYPTAISPGMEQLNENLYYVGFVNGDTFTLCDVNGVGIDGRNFTPFVNNGIGCFTLTGPSLFVQNIATMP